MGILYSFSSIRVVSEHSWGIFSASYSLKNANLRRGNFKSLGKI